MNRNCSYGRLRFTFSYPETIIHNIFFLQRTNFIQFCNPMGIIIVSKIDKMKEGSRGESHCCQYMFAWEIFWVNLPTQWEPRRVSILVHVFWYKISSRCTDTSVQKAVKRWSHISPSPPQCIFYPLNLVI